MSFLQSPVPSGDDYYASLSAPTPELESSSAPKKLKIKAKIIRPDGEAPVVIAPVQTIPAPIEEPKPLVRATLVRRAEGVPPASPAPKILKKVEVIPESPKAPAIPEKIVVTPPRPNSAFSKVIETMKTEEPKRFINPEATAVRATLVRRDGAFQPRSNSTQPQNRSFSPARPNSSGGPRPGGPAPTSDASRPMTIRDRLNDQKQRKGGEGTDSNGARRGKIRMVGSESEDDGRFRRSKKHKGSKTEEKKAEDVKQILTDKSGQTIELPEVVAVKEFSEKIGVPLPKIIMELMKNGVMVNLNSKIDFDTCFLVASALEVTVIKAKTSDVSLETLMTGSVNDLLVEDDRSKWIVRAPIVSIMGHVDHGKTSILDYIRKTEIAKGEAGGITQKIGAYQIERNGQKITFLDTPGHEAFTLMRARGARLTDVSVIVIAADEGMKPQTIESISHAKQAGVIVIVAVNKMDKPGANLEMIKGQLAEHDLTPEEWGGSTIVVPVSAHTGLGIEKLLEMILLTTEIMELKANPHRSAVATVIEAHLDPQIGPIATVLVNGGTLNKGDFIVCASASGRVRFLRDYRGKNVDSAEPGMPVLVAGLNGVVQGGDILRSVDSSESASTQAHDYDLAQGRKSIKDFEGASLASMVSRLKAGALKQVKIVLKSDSNGSLEALKAALGKLTTAETTVQIIHAGVGDVNESDVLMAGTSQALLVGYNVSVNISARQTLRDSQIEFIDKKVIYHILERVEAVVTGMVDLKHEELELGRAKVKAIFYAAKDKVIIGLEVFEGKLENKAKLRVIRWDKSAGKGEIANLRSGNTDVKEISSGECGISFKWDAKIEVGDILEAYRMVVRKDS